METLSTQGKLLKTFTEKKFLTQSIKLQISAIIGKSKQKSVACAEMLEVIEECQTEEEIKAAIWDHYKIRIK